MMPKSPGFLPSARSSCPQSLHFCAHTGFSQISVEDRYRNGDWSSIALAFRKAIRISGSFGMANGKNIS